MPVAIKMMRHNLVSNPDFLANFRNEAKIIAGLNHDQIIRVYDIEERFRTVFLITEHLQGESLQSLLQRLKRIPPMLAADFLIQICSGLGAAHHKGIFHRDINAANIFIQTNDRLKILDFGNACLAGTEDYLLGGALPYLAPELIDGQAADERSDIYALGITAYEITTGKRPYPEDNAGLLMKLHRKQDIPDPAEIVPDLPRVLRRFIARACRRDPSERYRHVNQALEDLHPLSGKATLKYQQPDTARHKMATVFLSCPDDQQQALERLLEEFRTRARELGIDLKTA